MKSPFESQYLILCVSMGVCAPLLLLTQFLLKVVWLLVQPRCLLCMCHFTLLKEHSFIPLWHRVSPFISGWPGTFSVYQNGPRLTGLPTSVSWVLGLKVWLTMSGLRTGFVVCETFCFWKKSSLPLLQSQEINHDWAKLVKIVYSLSLETS